MEYLRTRTDPRVVIVTGASSGVGEACAVHLARAGDLVYGLSRRCSPAPEMRNLTFLATDVTDEASVSEAVTTVFHREGRVDVLVNCAGFGLAGSIEDTSDREAQAQFEVNFFGTLRLCRAVLPIMRVQQSGYIVNMGSIIGLIAVPYQGLYSASKFALEGLTESLRLETGSFGIRVVLLEPGDHKTGFTLNRSYTAASRQQSAYRDKLTRAVDRMASDEQSGPGPDGVARLLLRVLDTPKPRLRYTTGPLTQRAAVWLKRLAPYAIVEEILATYYRCK